MWNSYNYAESYYTYFDLKHVMIVGIRWMNCILYSLNLHLKRFFVHYDNKYRNDYIFVIGGLFLTYLINCGNTLPLWENCAHCISKLHRCQSVSIYMPINAFLCNFNVHRYYTYLFIPKQTNILRKLLGVIHCCLIVLFLLLWYFFLCMRKFLQTAKYL